MLRILTLTSLFPNVVQPRHGVFVEERLRQLLATGEVAAEILAPVPWFPSGSRLFGRYGDYARIPAEEVRLGRTVRHPRYPTIPRIGMSLAPLLMRQGLRQMVRQVCAETGVEVIDSHFLYPDGVAACQLGQELGIPVVMTARGSDVNQLMSYRVPRRLILAAVTRCARVITVSSALREVLLGFGVEPDRVVTLRNGVDLLRFRPATDATGRAAIRQRLGLRNPTLLSVGNLLELKGHHLLIEALPQLPGVHAVIVGEGPMRPRLVMLARSLGVAERVRILNHLTQAELVEHYRAADGLVLASRREGMPNVVLESLACGTPVIATAVGGIPEVMDSPIAGALLPARTAADLAAAVATLLRSPPDRQLVAAHGRRFGWQPTIAGLLEVLRGAARSVPRLPGSQTAAPHVP